MLDLKEFLTPEYVAIAVIAILIIVAIFFAIVTNKVIGVDNRMAELTENIHNKVEKDINVLSKRLHDDIQERDAKHKAVMDNLGDSWRDSLEKTVSEVRGEIGKFKGEANYSTENLRDTMMKIISDNAVDFNQQIGNVRDVNAQAIEEYHQNLTQQMREAAEREQQEMRGTLDSIAKSVDQNVSDLVGNQKEAVDKIVKSVSSGYQSLAKKVEQDISQSTGNASETLANVTNAISTSVDDASSSLNESLGSISKEVDASLTQVNTRMNESLGGVAKDMAENFDAISKRLNADIDSVTGKLDGNISDVSSKLGDSVAGVSNKLDESISDVSAKLGSGMQEVNKKIADDLASISGDMDTGIDGLGKKIDANFDKVGTKVNKRIKQDMRDMLETFQTFASKVEAIESTREHIAQLAENVNVLAQVLDDRRTRGNVGEVLIESIVKDALSPGDYELNAELSNGFKVDCLLKLPQPSGNIAISTKIDISDMEVILAPTESAANVKKARDAFGGKLAEAIDTLADKCVIEGETADGALLLLPGESAFSEAHVNHRKLVDQAYKKQVWLASPSTLIAMVTVARAVIKDATARREVEKLRAALNEIEREYSHLEHNIERQMHQSDEAMSRATDIRKEARRISDRFSQLHSIIRINHETGKIEDARSEPGKD